ncbi:spore germination protein [Peribacillus frigoritolerans]|uniref:spore germination protein n=1 Tax=Peribacillus frigoritolerans TaxID=450367 RepID=UPI002B2465FB|nr:spore germination protein [Peribacillus frigoritolerans]MEB2491785.1 spore germination protein [Peribacillus frigoritolerans]
MTNSIIVEINEAFKDAEDFFIEPFILDGEAVLLLGLHSIVNLIKTKEILKKDMDTSEAIHSVKVKRTLFKRKCVEINSEEAKESILQGKLIVYSKEKNIMLQFEPLPKELTRSIEPPANENVLQGPLDSFIEDMSTNIGIVRKKVSTAQLSVKTYTVGSDQKKNLSIVYLNDRADKSMIKKIISHIEMNQHTNILYLQHLYRFMGMRKWDVIPQFNNTEMPLEAVEGLNKGKVILFVEGYPFALILPHLLWDMFVQANDRNYAYPIMGAIRFLRVLGALITLIFPAIYVALVAVNPEILKIELALSIAQSREGIPYPPFVEITIMLLIIELIIEASIRLPLSIGPTVTMVGGIVIGQAVVDAKLVSNLLIIIVAATSIANSSVVGFQNALILRLLKYVVVIFASIYGVLGILSGLVFISAYFASREIFGIPYTSLAKRRGEIG